MWHYQANRYDYTKETQKLIKEWEAMILWLKKRHKQHQELLKLARTFPFPERDEGGY